MSALPASHRRRYAALVVVALTVVVPPRFAAGAVLAWREGMTLHLTNDPSSAPADASVRRFEARARPAEPPVRAIATAPCPVAAVPQVATDTGPVLRASISPIVIAPTIVVRSGETQVTVVSEPALSGFYDGSFFPTGFIGHEHPQVPFLAGRRLVPHSHFFAHGRPGFFTPWGHFSTHGILATSVPSY